MIRSHQNHRTIHKEKIRLGPSHHAISDIGQDTISLFDHPGALLTHVQMNVNQHLLVLFCWTAFQLPSPKPMELHGVVQTHVQHATQISAQILRPNTPSKCSPVTLVDRNAFLLS